MNAYDIITDGKAFLGIELGSTRIKAVLIDEEYSPIAEGIFEWENKFEGGFWTYSLDEIHRGVKTCYASLCDNVSKRYGAKITSLAGMGVSAMMHGYMAFNESGELLVPFRTWRNTTTEAASEELSGLLSFNIPQRWSISHLYQAILDKEEHVGRISYITTLAVYIHYLLTGKRVAGVGEASGIFPVSGISYNEAMLEKTHELFCKKGFDKKLCDILPSIMSAGEMGCYLTAEGAAFLDESGNLMAGVPVCPPEGDAGTGMVASNAVRVRTGNISAGTSVFAMPVLEKPLSRYYPEIDIVSTPDGKDVAMVHCNNCCCELDAWVKVFGEFARLIGKDISKSELYELLYKNAMSADPEKDGILSYNFLSGEPVAGTQGGRPMYLREPDSSLSLSSFMKAQLMTAFASLKIGMDILSQKEGLTFDSFTAHGGIFKVKGVAQQIVADALGTPITVNEAAGEGGAWGMALLAAFMIRSNGRALPDWLSDEVFAKTSCSTLVPDADGVKQFERYMDSFRGNLVLQKQF